MADPAGPHSLDSFRVLVGAVGQRYSFGRRICGHSNLWGALQAEVRWRHQLYVS